MAVYGNAQDLIALTGVKPTDLGLGDEVDPDAALTATIDLWLEQVSSHAAALLGAAAPADDSDPNWYGVVGVVERTVANVVTYARQSRKTTFVEVTDFGVKMLDASGATRRLKQELRAFLRSSVTASLFSSLTPQESCEAKGGTWDDDTETCTLA